MNALSSRTIAVEHVTILSDLPFAEVQQRLEAALPKLDPDIVRALADGDDATVEAYEKSGPALSIFLERDHGALLQIVGRPMKAIQYDIGNPLTASKMTRHRLEAGLYPPLRVLLFQDREGRAMFQYDLPSSQFGQFADEQVIAVARGLDASLEAALRQAAGVQQDQPGAES